MTNGQNFALLWEEQTLAEFENWLQDRILATKEAYLPVKHELKKNRDTEEK